MLTRRLALLSGISLAACGPANSCSANTGSASTPPASDDGIDWANLTEAQWRERLTPPEFNVLRREGTERPGSSPLNQETREGIYACAGCGLPLFSSETKYESGTGWPSFWQPLDGAVDTKPDYRIWTPRTEYHCARCGGHQGHVFEDGPPPTGQRWCNNGIALRFIPASEA
ncbi:peptide-methionine (R)-S-oxide reductase [Glycocaulis albus]|uniref:peptide-methionine (R)-S-oxide reductase n=1 Tax=Glycocaulis albus TaxID=1382801 RepID=A0ABQ1XLZ0_9PROT|nr:peptide-methionine (R)-S-oxide reductase MsrB [Glycocaulis albus]MBV5259846.1 peptide-methionine (R)-S-oxide reductase MsrB [Synechococcus moorigangaii CMS01]GGG97261.1 peptide-methionine (R)-S-oxide reductase [Glycocaulis albus]